jgi:hypothetical protein
LSILARLGSSEGEASSSVLRLPCISPWRLRRHGRDQRMQEVCKRALGP